MCECEIALRTSVGLNLVVLLWGEVGLVGAGLVRIVERLATASVLIASRLERRQVSRRKRFG